MPIKEQSADPKTSDILNIEGIASRGYGTIPKLVMFDQRLSPQAKGIYAYFASFAGAGTKAFPHRTTILRELNLSQTTYYKHLGQHIEAGYLSVQQQKVGGRFDTCIYTLHQDIECPAMSNDLEHGGNCGKMVENHVKSVDETASLSDKPMSEPALSEEAVYQEAGQPYIRNREITNRFDNKQECKEQSDLSGNSGGISIDAVKDMIDYDTLVENVNAGLQMRELLGWSCGPDDDKR